MSVKASESQSFAIAVLVLGSRFSDLTGFLAVDTMESETPESEYKAERAREAERRDTWNIECARSDQTSEKMVEHNPVLEDTQILEGGAYDEQKEATSCHSDLQGFSSQDQSNVIGILEQSNSRKDGTIENTESIETRELSECMEGKPRFPHMFGEIEQSNSSPQAGITDHENTESISVCMEGKPGCPDVVGNPEESSSQQEVSTETEKIGPRELQECMGGTACTPDAVGYNTSYVVAEVTSAEDTTYKFASEGELIPLSQIPLPNNRNFIDDAGEVEDENEDTSIISFSQFHASQENEAMRLKLTQTLQATTPESTGSRAHNLMAGTIGTPTPMFLSSTAPAMEALPCDSPETQGGQYVVPDPYENWRNVCVGPSTCFPGLAATHHDQSPEPNCDSYMQRDVPPLHLHSFMGSGEGNVSQLSLASNHHSYIGTSSSEFHRNAFVSRPQPENVRQLTESAWPEPHQQYNQFWAGSAFESVDAAFFRKEQQTWMDPHLHAQYQVPYDNPQIAQDVQNRMAHQTHYISDAYVNIAPDAFTTAEASSSYAYGTPHFQSSETVTDLPYETQPDVYTHDLMVNFFPEFAFVPKLEVLFTGLGIDGGSGLPSNWRPTMGRPMSATLEEKRRSLHVKLNEIDDQHREYRRNVQESNEELRKWFGVNVNPYLEHPKFLQSRRSRECRDSLAEQLIAVKRGLGQEATAPGFRSGNPRPPVGRVQARVEDQQERMMNQLGTLNPNAWRPQRGLPERSVSLLRAWLFEHFLHPYPKDGDKIYLAKQTGLTRGQVSNWFINARVRLWKPMVEELYMAEFPGADERLESPEAQEVSPHADFAVPPVAREESLPGRRRELVAPEYTKMNTSIDQQTKTAAGVSGYQDPYSSGYYDVMPNEASKNVAVHCVGVDPYGNRSQEICEHDLARSRMPSAGDSHYGSGAYLYPAPNQNNSESRFIDERSMVQHDQVPVSLTLELCHSVSARDLGEAGNIYDLPLDLGIYGSQFDQQRRSQTFPGRINTRTGGGCLDFRSGCMESASSRKRNIHEI